MLKSLTTENITQHSRMSTCRYETFCQLS